MKSGGGYVNRKLRLAAESKYGRRDHASSLTRESTSHEQGAMIL
jgi:hypothetical protein